MGGRKRVLTPAILTLWIAGAALVAFEAAGLAATDSSDVEWQWGWLGLYIGLAILGIGVLRFILNLRRWRKS